MSTKLTPDKLQVAYEYIACQQKNLGTLILSEFAGAAHSLNGSLIVNPWNTAETANAINKAVTMPEDARKENHRKLFDYVSKYTASHWVRCPSLCSGSAVSHKQILAPRGSSLLGSSRGWLLYRTLFRLPLTRGYFAETLPSVARSWRSTSSVKTKLVRCAALALYYDADFFLLSCPEASAPQAHGPAQVSWSPVESCPSRGLGRESGLLLVWDTTYTRHAEPCPGPFVLFSNVDPVAPCSGPARTVDVVAHRTPLPTKHERTDAF